jgi:hypothetical protein
MITKTKRIDLKASEADEKNLRKAAENMTFETGKTPNVSSTIMHAVKEYADKEPYYFNAVMFKMICQLHESSLKHYAAIADSFLLLNFGPITLTDFQQIEAQNFSSIQKRFFEGIEDNIQKLNLTNDFVKNNLRSGTDEPYNIFHEKASMSLENIRYSKSQGPPLPLSVNNYTLKNGTVTFTDENREKIKADHCTTRLDSDTRKHFAALAESTLKNLQELKAILINNNAGNLFGRSACFDEDSEQVWLDKETLKYVK